MQPQGEIDNTCPDQKPSTSTPEQSPVHQTLSDEVIDLNQSESNKTIVQRDTFFNVMQHTFEGVNLERNTQSGLMEIPTEPFLLASGDFLPILDKLGSKAFQPVKMDIRQEFYANVHISIRKLLLKTLRKWQYFKNSNQISNR